MKKAICYIFAFFLALFSFILITFTIVRFYTIGEYSFLKTLEKANYYESAVEQYHTVLKQNARPTNFPVELFDQVVKTEDVKQQMKEYIQSEFEGTSYTIDTTKIKEDLTRITNTYILEQNIHVDERTKEAIQTFINANTSNYETMLKFPYFNYIGKGMRLFRSIYFIIAPVLLILCLILSIVQIRLHKSRRRGRRWLAYSWIGSGFMLCALPMVLIAKGAIERVQIEPKYIYDIVVRILNRSLSIMAVMGVILIVCGIALTYLKIQRKNKKRKGPRKYDKAVNTSKMVLED